MNYSRPQDNHYGSFLSKYARGHGFTFIEVMVAVGVFAVIATICYATLSQFLKVREGIALSQLEMRELQQTFTLMERDLRFMVARPVRDEYGDSESAVIFNSDSVEGELIRLTTSEPDLAVTGNSRLRRVGWKLRDGALYRDSWLVLDRVQDSEPYSRLVLRGVSQVEILGYQWDDELGVQSELELDEGELPYALEVLVTMDDNGEYRRIFDLANGT